MVSDKFALYNIMKFSPEGVNDHVEINKTDLLLRRNDQGNLNDRRHLDVTDDTVLSGRR